MKLSGTTSHLTYCLNVHPGESWQENLRAIREEATQVRDAVCKNEPFGLGLRLSAAAARELRDPGTAKELKQLLEAEGLYVFTINAFPYGDFHETRVKENVYKPDWTDPCRLHYTLDVAKILAQLVPEGMEGSISTVPVSYRGFGLDDSDVMAATGNLLNAVEDLALLEAETDRRIVLAIEPEPDCLVGTVDEFVSFYNEQLLVKASWSASGEDLLRRHVGICFDTAHAAMQFEEFVPALARVVGEGIAIAKMQLSSALTAPGSPESVAALQPFCEPVYLHQTNVRLPDGHIAAFTDLPEALANLHPEPGQEWRVHYHVPLFWRGNERLGSTANLIPEAVQYALENDLTQHLEIETYTFTVLPPELAPPSLAEGIANEFHWLLEQIGQDPA